MHEATFSSTLLPSIVLPAFSYYSYFLFFSLSHFNYSSGRKKR